MFGIVTLLDGERGDQVRSLWAELATAHGPEVMGEQNLPHLTYHVADEYDREAVRALLERLAAATPAFAVRAAGLGFVAREHFVVWLNAVRSPPLTALHEALWDDATAAGTGVYERYGNETWFPHATLGDGDLMRAALPELAQALRDGRLPETIAIDNLALIEEVTGGHELIFRFSLARG